MASNLAKQPPRREQPAEESEETKKARRREDRLRTTLVFKEIVGIGVKNNPDGTLAEFTVYTKNEAGIEGMDDFVTFEPDFNPDTQTYFLRTKICAVSVLQEDL